MTQVNPTCYHMSASSIASFKACPQRFRLSYREGIRADKDSDSQRMGTNWHSMHETYANELATAPTDIPGTTTAEYALMQVAAVLDEVYQEVPSWKTPLEWAVEKQVLYVSFLGYLWYWQNDPVEFLYSELAFNLPLHMPRTGLPLPLTEVQRVGKIDHVISWNGAIGALERKSTSRGIEPDSDYWDKSKKDTQVSMYALAFRDMYAAKQLPEGIALHVLFKSAERFGNTLYDVWHKPTIKPAMLTQKETAEFVHTGIYKDQKFLIAHTHTDTDDKGAINLVSVDSVSAEVEQGKKGFAIRETVAMYGARLLQDIYERPDFYYVRREISRTDAEIREFRRELFAIYQAQKAFAAGDFWFSNESQCRATFPCSYIPICYGSGASSVCDGKTTPAGFKRIFVDLTVNGQEREE